MVGHPRPAPWFKYILSLLVCSFPTYLPPLPCKPRMRGSSTYLPTGYLERPAVRATYLPPNPRRQRGTHEKEKGQKT